MPYDHYGYYWDFPYEFVGKRVAVPTASDKVVDARNTICATGAYDDRDSRVTYARFSFWTRNLPWDEAINTTSFTASARVFGRWK